MADGSVTIKVDLDGSNAQSGVSKLKTLFGGLSQTGSKVGSVFKSVLGANLIGSALTNGISTINSGIRGMVSELNSSSKAWKTFEGNLQAFGRSAKEIKVAKDEMKDFAAKTIYSASDMASTYAQLDAVGTKNVGSLVKAFGGLAASAENPKQAMKSLSTQATQMAAKPKVAWQDFKIIMDQAPAGIAAVAKEMGLSTEQLVSAVQDGKVKTEDFFDALNRAGNSDAFQKMATEFKTVDQAIDGARESLLNNFMPAFEVLNKFGIKAINALSDALSKINFDKLAQGLDSFLSKIDVSSVINRVGSVISSFVGKIRTFWNAFSNTGAVKAFLTALQSVGKAVGHVFDSLTSSGILNTLGSILGNIVKWLSQAATMASKFISSLNPGIIQSVVGGIAGLILAVKGLNFLKSFNPFSIFKKNATDSIKDTASGITSSKSKIAQIFESLSSVIKSLGTSISIAARGIGNGLKSVFQGIGQALSVANPVNILALSVAILAIGSAMAIVGTQGDGIKTILEGLGEAVSKVASVIIGALANAIKTVAPALGTLSPLVIAVGQAFALVVTAFGKVAPQIAVLVSAISSGVAQIITALAPIVQIIGTVITSIAQIIADAVVKIVQIMVENAPQMVNIINAITAAIQASAPILIALINGIVTAIQALAPVLSDIVNGIVSIVQQLAPILTAALNGIATVIESVGTAISSAAQGIGQGIQSALEGVASVITSIGQVIGTALNGIANIIQSVGQSISTAAQGIGKGIESAFNGISNVITAVGNSIKSVLDGLANVFNSIGNAALKAGQGFKALAQGVVMITNTNLGDMAASLAAVATGIGAIAAVSGGMASVGAGMKSLGQGLVLVQSSGSGAVTALQSIASAVPTISSSISNLAPAMSTASAAMSTFASSVASSFAGLIGSTTSIAVMQSRLTALNASMTMAQSGASAMSTGFSVVSSVISTLSGLLSSVPGKLSLIATSFSTISSTATSSMNSLNSAVRSAMTQAVSTMRSSMQQMVSVVRQSATQMTQAGQQAGHGVSNGVTAGIISGIGSATSAMRSMTSAIYSTALSGVGVMVSVGAQIANGLAQGMYSALGAVTAAANALVAEAERAAQAKAKIHSPSRLFRDNVGRYIAQGIAVGIEKNTSDVTDSLAYVQKEMSAFKFGAEELLGLGNNSLSSQFKLKSITERAEMSRIEVVREKADQTITRALEVAEEAVKRPVNVLLDDGTLVAKIGNPMTSYQNEKIKIDNMMRGII